MPEQSVVDELQRMWKEDILTQTEVLFQHLPGGTEQNHE
jgi:hypothetical protein